MNAPSTNHRDGCPEFDFALMDLAAGDAVDAATREHLARCGRCSLALAAYRGTIDAVRGTVTTLTPRARMSFTWMHAAAALIVIALGARLARHEPPPRIVEVAAIDARPSDDAALTRLDADTARLDAGLCTFLMGSAMGVVQTPLGAISCNDCAFTVRVGPLPELVDDDACNDDMHVQIEVLRGLVATSMLDQPRVLAAGQWMTISGP